ncbi:MAG: glycosyltransferase [Gammaproteobacteria bacterium]
MTSPSGTPRATERLRSSRARRHRDGVDLIGHLNLARGFRGGERQTQLLVEGLAQWGLHQRLIVRANEPLASRVRSVESVQVSEQNGSLLRAARACRGCSLIHVHDGRSVHAASLAHALYRVPYVITRRVDNPIRSNWLTRRAYRRAACVAVLSGAIEKQVRRVAPAANCLRVPDAASAFRHHKANVERLRKRYKDRFIVGHIGALDHAHKGQQDLFAAARELAITHPKILFLLLGAGKDEATFRAQTADLANVELVGHVDNVGDYLAVFDAFAFPSLHEGMGSTLLDAMDFGLPVVATRVGGIVDLITDDDNGLLVAPANPDQLRFAIARLHDEPALAARLAGAGRQFVQEFTPEKMVNRYLETYQPLIGTETILEQL